MYIICCVLAQESLPGIFVTRLSCYFKQSDEMRSSIALLSFAALATAGAIKRQSGPVEPDTDPDCSYYDNAYSERATCQDFVDFWGMDYATFVA